MYDFESPGNIGGQGGQTRRAIGTVLEYWPDTRQRGIKAYEHGITQMSSTYRFLRRGEELKQDWRVRKLLTFTEVINIVTR